MAWAVAWVVWGTAAAAPAHGPQRVAAAPASAALACGPDAPRLLPLEAGAQWWVPGQGGDANPDNRGRTDNQWVLRHAGRVWLLGSGASPAAARALGCVLHRDLHMRVSDVVNPWARPELVMGNAGFRGNGARLWAHEDVAQAMRQQCPRCVERLHLRLGPAAVDLGPSPIVLPTQGVRGAQGALGPWRWWRLVRAPGAVVTVWHLPGSNRWWAPGLLWGDGPPDLRDTSAEALDAALAQLQALSAPASEVASPAQQWLPTQGAWLERDALAQHRAYLAALQAAVQARQEAGALETDPTPPLPGVPAGWQRSERASMNWQRTWRQMEARAWEAAPSASAPR